MSGSGSGPMPVPCREKTTLALSGSLEPMVSVHDLVPSDMGPNMTLRVLLEPWAMVGVMLPTGLLPPVTFRTKFVVSESVIPETIRSASPSLCMVITTSAAL